MGISKQLYPIQFMVDQKQLVHVEYFDTRCTHKIKDSTATTKAAFNNKKLSSTANWT